MRKLISALKRPLISTSANISGTPSPATFDEISDEIKSGVDYIVPREYDTSNFTQPSRLVRFLYDDKFVVIRD